MNFRFRNLRIAVRLALLGVVMLAATVIVGFGGWRGLARIHQLQAQSANTAAKFAAAVDTARIAQVDFKKQVQEWKDLLLRGANPDAFKKYHDGFTRESDTVKSDLGALKKRMTELGIRTEGVDQALATHDELGSKYLAAIRHYDAKDPESMHVVDGMVAGIDRAPTAAIDGLVTGMQRDAAAESRQIDAESNAAFDHACALLAAVVLGAMLAAATLIWLLAYSITAPIGRALKIAQAVAQGDLTTELVVDSQDETGRLLAALDSMNGKLRQVVQLIRMGSREISASTREIANGNQDLSARTCEQAAALEETSASMQKFTDSVHANADTRRAREACQMAESATDVARQSGTAMSQAVTAMLQVQNVASRITEITETMDRIATQTHILALNASVEAARAGEAGRGFSIVALEVQALARNSRTASTEIRKLIGESVTIIESGTQMINHAESMVGKLLDNVDMVAQTVNTIAAQSMEQAATIQQVNRVVQQLDEVTQSNAALVEEAAAAADTVQIRAHALVESVEFFQLDDRNGAAEHPAPVLARKATRSSESPQLVPA